MKRILVPVDFSPTSKKASRYAVDIASRSGGTVILCHFFKPLKSSDAGAPHNVRATNHHLEANNLKRLQRLKKKVLADTKEVTVSTLVGRIPVVKNILKFAESNQIDFIVMGTQGATGLKKITVGSVAAKVMERSGIPVLLVPEKFAWKKPEKIVFTTTISKSDNNVLPVLLSFANLYRTQITVVNLRDPHQMYGYKEKEEFEMYAYSVQRTFDDVNIKFRQLDTFSVEKTMETLYDEIPYDVLIMARRKLDFVSRFVQKSFTKKMAHITELPLLIVPEK
jgi:nucleotide-binding universal stress UspA family protein